MNRTTVFSKTGKGLLEIKNKSNRLSKDQFRVLNLVDGKATLDDLVDKSRITEVELRKLLAALSDGGFIKEFTNPTATGDYTSVTIPPVPPSTSYVDDLDFTQILGPAKSSKPGFYQSAQTEQRQREESERKASELAATKAREEAEKRAKEDGARRAREEETARRVREEAERKAKEEQTRREKLEAEMRYRLEEPKRLKEEADRKAREKLEAEKRVREEAERKAREETERRAKIQAEAAARVEAERKRREEEERRRKEEEEERRRREEEERKRREEEERRRKEEEERKRKEEEERKRKEEEERKRKEEEERRRKEEEERKRKEEEERRRKEEEERKRKEEEERKRKEEEERRRKEEEERRREEEERKRKEEEERKRKEEAERLRKELEERHRREEQDLLRRLEQGLPSEEEERKQREEEARQEQERQEQERRRREEEDDRRRRAEEERQRRDDEARERREREERSRKEADDRRRRDDEDRSRRKNEDDSAWSPLPTLEATAIAVPEISTSLDSDFDALKRAEAEVEKEFMAKEEAIRKALEEQERRFRMEEEARTAMDRAEREAREKADQEARELAEAAERARRDAEQRAREESVRRQQEEKEKRAKEQEERKKKGEEERKKRERERREQEQRAREEGLAKKRAEQEELDRKKSERERLAREAKKRAWGPGRIALVAGVALIAALIGAVQIAPLTAYAPEMEKLASERLGEPVRIGGVHASVFPAFHLKLENVTVGQQQDVRVPSVTAYMDIGSVFGGEKLIKSLEIEQLQATQDLLARLPGWLADDGNKGANIKVRKIVLKDTKLDVKGAVVPAFNAQVYLGADGAPTRALISTVDGHFDAEVFVAATGTEVNLNVKNFLLPLGPPMEITEGTAKGVLSGSQIHLTEMDLFLYGGQVKGQAAVSWGSPWNLEGDFDLKRIDLEAAMKAFKIGIASEGQLDGKGRYNMQSNSLATLFDNPRVEATFNVQKGALSSFDFVRALQTPSRDGVQGGKTKFDELSGSLSVAGTRYTYSNVRLRAGLLAASGACEILPNREISGRAYVELRSSSNAIKNTFRITGNLKAIVLKP